MKRYINGYDNPSFEFTIDGVKKKIKLSSQYTRLLEYEEEIVTLDKFTDGSKELITHYYDYEWRLIWSDEIELIERKKIEEIQNAIAGRIPVSLIPHDEYPWRHFSILISPEKRSIELDAYFEGFDDTTNFGYEMSLINKEPIKKINIADPNFIPIIACRVGSEY